MQGLSGAARRLALALLIAASTVLAAAAPAGAANASGTLVDSADCTQHQLNRNDDGSTNQVALPFSIDFWGKTYDKTFVNNNGNVTFDEPLGIYTPFALTAPQQAIIAPFFADVDTRSGGDTVKYGWGNTTFDSHRAFCANWVDVGYYNQHYDKLNSFQLLLVDRSDIRNGDFDIVFNYGSINWETGDASEGVNGFGGESARVGFANGDGTNINSYELPLSGHDGALLDSNPATGLIHNSIGTNRDGRYVWHIRNGQPAPDTYVAMGDSFQSGEGAGDYEAGTDSDGVNQCHRSAHAYPHRLVDRGAVTNSLDFVACSGATIPHLTSNVLSTSGPPWNEGAQFDHLSESTALATLGAGGNDLGFAKVLQDCIVKKLAFGSCQNSYDDDILDRLLELQSHTAPENLNTFQKTYDDARSRAWRAKLLVLGYPRFFPNNGGKDWSTGIDGIGGALFGDGRCQSIRVSDQLWINHKIQQVNNAIESSANSMGAEYVDIYDVPDGHELCGDSDDKFMNGVKPTNIVESFHPNSFGHGLIADKVEGQLPLDPPADREDTIQPGETLEFPWDVPGGLLGWLFSSIWPGSDVEMTLISPSGKVYTRETVEEGLYHRNGPTQEIYHLTNPEAGRWTVRLYGKDVDPGGEKVRFNTYGEKKPNQDPQASMAITKTGKNTIRAGAAGSFDPDGSVVDYLWDFGDGTLARGPEVTHRFKEPGTYRVTLVVKDNDDGLGFAADDQEFVLTPYAFSGFKPPVNNRPTVNTANAGRAIPVKFSLGGNQGLDIFEPGSPRVQRIDCATGAPVDEIETLADTPGASTLTYDSGSDTYQYVWKTDKAWAGTCRRLVLGLNDSSDHGADFRFR
jgi:hypothetical protein